MSEKCKNYKFDEYDEIEIWAMADLHIGHESFDLKEFIRYRDWTLERPNRFILGLGDYIENVSSGRWRSKVRLWAQRHKLTYLWI